MEIITAPAIKDHLPVLKDGQGPNSFAEIAGSAYTKDALLSGKSKGDTVATTAFLDVPPLSYGAETARVELASSKSAKTKPPGERIAKAAADYEGEELWRQSPYKKLTVDGKFGCAASASVALEHAGYKYANSPTVGGLDAQLQNHGWTVHKAKDAQPGDVMVAYNGKDWRKGGGDAHVGIVAEDGGVYNNSKRNNHRWTNEPAGVAFGDYGNRYVLRPPAK